MKNYYEILSIQEDATPIEIKKAYFSLVRKYPADRFPDEFMKIRESYEALSNEKTKQEYDKMMGMTATEREAFQLSRQLMEEGNIKGAIKTLEKLLKYQETSHLVRGLLAEAYLYNGNSGKAVNILQNLVEEDSNNAGFKGHLARAYTERGWHKKGISTYKEALEIDEDNLSLWLGLANAYMTGGEPLRAKGILLEALEKGKDWDNISIYFHLLQIDIILQDKKEMKRHVKDLSSLALEKEETRQHIGWLLGELAEKLTTIGFIDEALVLLKEVHVLLPDNKEITELMNKVEVITYIGEDMDKLVMDTSIKKEIKELIEIEVIPREITGMPEEYRKNMVLVMEFHILVDIHIYKKSINCLKKNYPRVYEKKASFFEGAMDKKIRNKMLMKYEKKRGKMENFVRSMVMDYTEDEDFQEEEYYPHHEVIFHDDDFTVYEDSMTDDELELFLDRELQKPIVREESKTGRNQPCPCGSGKKYKKCCG